jgi:hypothetical protein
LLLVVAVVVLVILVVVVQVAHELELHWRLLLVQPTQLLLALVVLQTLMEAILYLAQ